MDKIDYCLETDEDENDLPYDPLKLLGANKYPEFATWLRRQVKRDDRVGDVARDLKDDKCARGLNTALELRNHMADRHRAIPAALESLLKAFEEFRASSGQCNQFDVLEK